MKVVRKLTIMSNTNRKSMIEFSTMNSLESAPFKSPSGMRIITNLWVESDVVRD